MSTDLTAAEDVAAELGSAIAETPEYRRFEAAKAAVEDSPEAQAEIDAFERKREEFVLARQAGEATQADLRELQQAQAELHEIDVVADYLEAQNELEARLAAIDDAISEPLALDFAEQAGGCCAEE